MFFLKNIHFFQLSFATFEQPYLFDSVATQLHARGKKNVLLGVARASNTQVAAMLREKNLSFRSMTNPYLETNLPKI